MTKPSLLFFSLLLLLATACGTTTRSTSHGQGAVDVAFSADSAYAFCAAQCQFGPRTMNSQAHELCSQWIQQQFRRFGYDVQLQQADLRGYDGTTLRSTNIIAAKPAATAAGGTTTAAGGQATTDRILICAHWDSRPWADNDLDDANWHKPVMAANDGASGVAVMLELARLLQQHDSARVAVDFICFDAEDWGVPQWSGNVDGDSWALGAQHWAARHAAQPKGERTSYRYAVLLDMVGGQGARFFREGYSMRHAAAVVDRVWSAAAAAGYGSMFVNDTGGYITDDHVPLNEVADIPTADIIPYYPDCEQSSFGPTWHTVSDDMQHIDRNTLQAVGQTLVQLLFTED